MKVNKKQLQLMKRCLGIKFKSILSHKLEINQNCYPTYKCELEDLKLWNDLCKMKLAYHIWLKEKPSYYCVSNKGIEYLEVELGLQLSIKKELDEHTRWLIKASKMELKTSFPGGKK